MKLRQVALVAAELEPVSEALQDVFGLGEPYDDPGVGEFGLHNVVFPIADTYLEVVSPKQEGTTAERYLQRRKGDGGYMALFQTNDIAQEKRRMKDLGVRTVWEADLDDAKAIHLHPRDVGGAIMSLDVMIPVQSWRWAGPGWEARSKTDVTSRIVGVELQAEDPEALAARWADVLNAKAVKDGRGYRIDLDFGTHVHVMPADNDRGDGIAGVDLMTADKDAILANAKARGIPHDRDCVEICGTKFYLK
jgi:hypothetical protein